MPKPKNSFHCQDKRSSTTCVCCSSYIIVYEERARVEITNPVFSISRTLLFRPGRYHERRRRRTRTLSF